MEDGGCPGFEAAVIAIDRVVLTHLRVLEAVGCLLAVGSSTNTATSSRREPWFALSARP